MQNQGRIRIAVQKSGRLSDDSLSLLQRCGIKLKQSAIQLLTHSENFPLDVLYVRDDDIPNLVMDGVCDLGIVGTNVLEEKSLQRPDCNNIKQIMTMEFGACRLSIAVPENFDYQNCSSLQGKHIATSYPNILQRYLDENNISAVITELSGSVEIAPHLNIAHAICDLVSTGATLEANGLQEVATIFQSQAVMIANEAQITPEKQIILDRLVTRIQGAIQATESKYIMLHVAKDKLSTIRDLLPGSEQPTVINLDNQEDKVAVHAVCQENVFWETMESLRAAGATSILVLPVEKMLP